VLNFLFGSRSRLRPEPTQLSLVVGTHVLPLTLVRHPRARRYSLRLRPDGTARVTIPRGGTTGAARAFAERNLPWLAQQLQKLAARPRAQTEWHVGTEILFRGETVRLASHTDGFITVGDQRIPIVKPVADLRPLVEKHLRDLANVELPARLQQLAGQHSLTVRRILIRNQRTRWGSCSRRGTISLNWRLIQTPPHVQDYICLHELAHRLELNHSPRFWAHVERMCPDYRAAERWLKQSRAQLPDWRPHSSK
jgi:hypothetical protein